MPYLGRFMTKNYMKYGEIPPIFQFELSFSSEILIKIQNAMYETVIC